jgi:hypothetical protein
MGAGFRLTVHRWAVAPISRASVVLATQFHGGQQMTRQAPRKLLAPKAASELINVPSGTMSNWRIRDYGPAYFKVGHHVRYDEEDLVKWLERNRVEPDQREAR